MPPKILAPVRRSLTIAEELTAGLSLPKFALINPIRLAEPFDHADWVFEAKYDGFRALADTVHGRLISRHDNRMTRFEAVLDLLAKGYVFGGELVVLDDAGHPLEAV